MSSTPNFCRLCLKKFTGLSKILNSDLKAHNMVKHLFPGMDINLVKISKICPDCFKYVQFSHIMRETVTKNEQKVNSNVASLRTIEENTCRLCFNVDIEAKVFLYETINQAMPFLEARSIIEIAIVAMRFDIFKKPVVCNSCWQIVRSIYLFKKRCFATEKILKFYCSKNNLTSLTDSELESVSNCYNSNLQKYSEGIKHDLNTSLMHRESKDDIPQTTNMPVKNIVKPLDIYLNNFISDDEDDVFEEEVDDIFVEKPRVVKTESTEALVVNLQEGTEKQKKIVDVTRGPLEEIIDATSSIKREEMNRISTNQEKTNVDVQEIIHNFQENSESNSNIVLEECVETGKKSTTNHLATGKDTDVINCRAEIINNLDINFEQIDTVASENNVTGRHKYKQKKIKSKIKEVGSHNKILEKPTKSQVKNQKKSLKDATKKRKKQAEKLKDKGKPTPLVNRKETLEVTMKEIKNKIKKLGDVELSKSVENYCKDIETSTETCKKVLKSIQEKIKKHLDSRGNVEWLCNKCQFKTKYKHHLNRHMLVHNESGNMLTCSKCVYSTDIQRNFDRHMLKHTLENYLHCAYCIYSTTDKNHMKQHMTIHEKCEVNNEKEHESNDAVQSKQPLAFKCQECPFSTSKEAQIIAHLRTHSSKEKVFKCTQCHYITTRTHSLRDHMELHNKESHEKKFKCTLCSFTGKRYTHLQSHMLMHQTEGKFSCNQCSYKAKRKNHLVTHMLRHQSGDKKLMFQCPYCKYKSIRREHLKCHCRNVHYDKEEIDYNAASITVEDEKSSFDRKKKTVKCPYCSYRSLSSSLDVHIFKGHFPSNSEEMECYDCSYKTDVRKNFLKHVKLHKTDDKSK